METQILYGRRACQAVFERRPHDIQRIYYRRDVAPSLGGLLAWAASRRIVYRELEEEELRKVARGAHHEGLVLAAEPLRYGVLDEEAISAVERWMAVDRVENPHNLGAILRTCAFLGVEALLAGGAEEGEKVNGAALRVAEGGAEYVRLYAAPQPGAALAAFTRRGRPVIGLETGGAHLAGEEFSGGPWVLVAGHEQEGLSAETRRACTTVRGIAGGGAVKSLNVSVAVGIALAALSAPPEPAPRYRPGPRPRPEFHSVRTTGPVRVTGSPRSRRSSEPPPPRKARPERAQGGAPAQVGAPARKPSPSKPPHRKGGGRPKAAAGGGKQRAGAGRKKR